LIKARAPFADSLSVGPRGDGGEANARSPSAVPARDYSVHVHGCGPEQRTGEIDTKYFGTDAEAAVGRRFYGKEIWL